MSIAGWLLIKRPSMVPVNGAALGESLIALLAVRAVTPPMDPAAGEGKPRSGAVTRGAPSVAAGGKPGAASGMVGELVEFNRLLAAGASMAGGKLLLPAAGACIQFGSPPRVAIGLEPAVLRGALEPLRDVAGMAGRCVSESD